MTAAKKRQKPAAKPHPSQKSAALPPEQAAVEARLDHRFARPELLELALTHRSHTYEAVSYTHLSLKGANMLLKSTTCAGVALPVRWSV